MEHTFLDGNQIVLGNSKGIMVINPRTLKDNDDNPIVKLSEVLLFGSEISHSQDEVLELSHDENELTFSFNPKSLSSTVNSTIWYKLNSEKHWHITTKENPKAHYPQLESGEYSLYVKTSLNGTNQMNKPLLTFRIRPPWWFSYWAIAGYLIIAFIVLKLIFNYSLISIKAKNKLEMQSFEKQQQEKLMQSKLDFFTNITHEIKTPLTLIIGPIEKLIKETSINKKATQSLNTVHKNAKHLQVLFDELLEFRRIESGVASLQLQEVEVVSFLRQIISHYNELAFLRSVSLNIQTDLSELNLLLDSLKIEKVVHNLLSNALKNTNEEGEILVILKCNNEQNFIEVAVENSGAGIPEELINVIFDQFVTGHENKGGSGVGLALSKRIIELHKGTIIARNTKKGALFTVTLPLLKPNKKEEEVIEVLENGANQQGQPSILIVEDNIEIRLFIISILERNYTIYTAGNGVEALEVVRSYEIDLILSDVMMPVMDGVELVKTIKNNLEYCHIPIMLLTAKAGIVHELEGLRAQADAYIYKPFNYEVLKQKIQNRFKVKSLLALLVKDQN